jgi:hypothetical protein
MLKRKNIESFKREVPVHSQVPVAYNCNPSYSGPEIRRIIV